MEPQKKIHVVFYRTAIGNEPVREWLKTLPSADKKSIGKDIKAVELNWPIGIPLVRKLDSNLWEVRSKLPGRISRVFFTVWEDFMVLLQASSKNRRRRQRMNWSLRGSGAMMSTEEVLDHEE